MPFIRSFSFFGKSFLFLFLLLCFPFPCSLRCLRIFQGMKHTRVPTIPIRLRTKVPWQEYSSKVIPMLILILYKIKVHQTYQHSYEELWCRIHYLDPFFPSKQDLLAVLLHAANQHRFHAQIQLYCERNNVQYITITVYQISNIGKKCKLS